MKKVIIAAALIAASLLLVSCFGKGKKAKGEDGDLDAVEVAKDLMDKAPEDRKSKEAAIYWLKKSNGIDFKDIAPTFEIDESTTYYADESGVKIYFRKKDGEYTAADHVADVRRIYAATAAVSEAGKNVVGFGSAKTKEEAMKEPDLEKMIEDGKPQSLFGIELYIGMYNWDFIKDDAFRTCSVGVVSKKVNGDDVKCGYSLDFYKALQMSWEDTEKVLNETLTDEVMEKAVKEYNKNK